MRLIREPSVYLVGRQVTIDPGIEAFVESIEVPMSERFSGGAQELAEVAGRMCYQSFGDKTGRKSSREYLEHIIESGHGSVLEHCIWNFIITGVSRSLSHELVRHHAGIGVSQLSQRYVDESTADFIEPDIIAEDAYCDGLWKQTIDASHKAYCALVTVLEEKIAKKHPGLSKTEKRKMARQAARSVLPNATETKLFWTANARAIRHVIEMRGGPAAETEIRKLAVQLLRIMQDEAPFLFADCSIVELPDGSLGVEVGHHKV